MDHVQVEPIDVEPNLDALRQDPRRAIDAQTIVCLICGGRFRQLTNTHLGCHGITSREYKERFGYNPGRALMSTQLRRVYAERAVRVGLASRIRWRPVVSEPELRRLGGIRPIRLEERLTRRDQRGKGRSSM
jgi:predicted transcriptional regulator